MSLYQHFRENEHEFVDQVLEWKVFVETRYMNVLTDFLNPRERQIVHTIVGETQTEIKVTSYGGSDETERKRMLITPFYAEMNEKDYEIELLEAKYNEKFLNLRHGDVLGATLGLGIERRKIGDIRVYNGKVHLIVTKDIALYIKSNLIEIGRANVQFEFKALELLLASQDEWLEDKHSVSSLRLDVIIKEIYKVSRSVAVSYIKKKHVKLNFKEEIDPSTQIYEEDLISVRGLGRSKVKSIDGKSRKNRTFISTLRLKV